MNRIIGAAMILGGAWFTMPQDRAGMVGLIVAVYGAGIWFTCDE